MNNELYHYGVKGMKWGVRRAQKDTATTNKHKKKSKVSDIAIKSIQKHHEKSEKRRKRIEETTKNFGVTGVAISSGIEYNTKKYLKGILARSLNSAANAYISANGSKNYMVSKGVDFARKSAINALSVSSAVDGLRYYSDIAIALGSKYTE